MRFKEKAWRRAAKFHQVGIVVADIEAAIEEMERVLGISAKDWARIDVRADGFEYIEPAGASKTMRAQWARAQSGATVYQLIAVDDQASVWSEALSAGRPVFAIAHFVDNVPEAMAQMQKDGAEPLAYGRVTEGESRYQYAFVRMPTTKLVIELMGNAID